MTELSSKQKDAIMKAIGLDGLNQESKDILLGLLNDNKTENITPKFHQGAAEIMELAKKTPIAKETRENFDKSRSLSKAVDMFVKAIKK